MADPKISVILNVMNGADLVGETIESVLDQTFRDFELIVIDDGSTDNTFEVVSQFKDDRIRAIRQENRGIPATVNRGLSVARSPYIARIDHDDLMLPNRLQLQYDFLQGNPEVAMLCGTAQLMHETTLSEEYYRAPVDSKALQLRLLFENPVVQSTVMMRTAVVRALGGYNEKKSLYPADDFELWTRISYQHKVHALQDVLTIYRIRARSASHAMRSISHNIEISAAALHRYLAPDYSLEQCTALAAIYHRYTKLEMHLPSRTALAMVDAATSRVQPQMQSWSTEFRSVAAMHRRMIFFHYWLRKPLLSKAVAGISKLQLRE